MDKINRFLLCVLLLSIVTLTTFSIVASINERRESPYRPDSVIVSPLLAPYVGEYLELLESADIEIPWGEDLVLIGFDPGLPNNILGIAWGMDIDNITVIDINMSLWPYLNHEKRRLLIFHELTHDVFNLRHFDVSLMDTPMPRFVTKLKVDSAMQELIKYLNNKK